MVMRLRGTESMLHLFDGFIEQDPLVTAVEEEAEGLLEEVKREAPVRSGRLRDSMTVEVEDDTLSINTEVEYADYVIFGTRHQPANNFVLRAYMKHKRNLSRNVLNNVNERLGETIRRNLRRYANR